MLAYELAASQDPDAAVSYYGSGIADRSTIADAISCPTSSTSVGTIRSSLAEVEAIHDALADRADVEFHVQAGAGHAFENSLAPAFYDEAAAKVSWPLTVEFLERHLQP